MGFTLDKAFTAFIILSAFLVGGFAVIGGFDVKYRDLGANYSTEKYHKVYDISDNISSILAPVEEKTGAGGEDSFATTEMKMFAGGYNALKVLGQLPSFMLSIVYILADELYIPHVFVTFFMAIVIIFITTFVVYMVFRFKP